MPRHTNEKANQLSSTAVPSERDEPEAVATAGASASEGGAAERTDYAHLATVIALLAGVAFRLLQYGGGRSLWLDEVLVARGVIERSFAELLSPSTWGAAPGGYLLLTKLSVSVFGTSEYALRLVPFIAGIASLFLFLALAKRCLTPLAVPFAVALFSFSPYLIYYASELKPYSTDAAISVVLLLAAFRLRSEGVTVRSAALWTVLVLAATVFSLTALLVGAGATVAMVVAAWREGDRRTAGRLSAAVLVWGVLMGGAYLILVNGTLSNEYARAFWRSGFMPLPPRSLADLAWFPRTFLQVFRDPLGVMSDSQSASGLFGAAAAMIAFVAGSAWMATRRRVTFWMIASPIVAALLASGLMLYPFGGSRASAGRVVLFLAPMFFLVIAEGAARIWDRSRGGLRLAAVPLLALLLVPQIAWAIMAVPFPRTEIKPLLGYLEEEHRPGDVVYVHYDIRHAFEYYAPVYQLDDTQYVRGVCSRDRAAGYLEALTALRGAPRVWVLFANGEGAGWFSEKQVMIDYLQHVGARQDDQVSGGAALYLYDLRPEAGSDAPYQANLPVVTAGFEDGCAFWG